MQSRSPELKGTSRQCVYAVLEINEHILGRRKYHILYSMEKDVDMLKKWLLK